MKPNEVEILVAEVGATSRRRRPDVPHPLRRHGHGRAGLHACSAARPKPIAERARRRVSRRARSDAARSAPRSAPWPVPSARSRRTSSRSRCSPAATADARSAASRTIRSRPARRRISPVRPSRPVARPGARPRHGCRPATASAHAGPATQGTIDVTADGSRCQTASVGTYGVTSSSDDTSDCEHGRIDRGLDRRVDRRRSYFGSIGTGEVVPLEFPAPLVAGFS